MNCSENHRPSLSFFKRSAIIYENRAAPGNWYQQEEIA